MFITKIRGETFKMLESKKDPRKALAKFEGNKVSCTGKFVSVRILDNGFINLLFRNVVVNGKYKYDHIWIVNNKYFENIGLKYGCDVSFTGIVQKYGNAERYGISFCKNVEVTQYNTEIENEEYINIDVQFKTVKYSNEKQDSQMKGYQNFIYDYGIELKSRCRLVYSPAKTLLNRNGEIEFEAYGNDGHMDIFKKISFNPELNHNSITVDGKYYVKITETAYRKLSLLYFLVKSSGYGCMVYVPEEEKENYAGIISICSKTNYYMNQIMLSAGKNRAAVQKAGVV